MFDISDLGFYPPFFCEKIPKSEFGEIRLGFNFKQLDEQKSLEWFATFILEERKLEEERRKKSEESFRKMVNPYGGMDALLKQARITENSMGGRATLLKLLEQTGATGKKVIESAGDMDSLSKQARVAEKTIESMGGMATLSKRARATDAINGKYSKLESMGAFNIAAQHKNTFLATSQMSGLISPSMQDVAKSISNSSFPSMQTFGMEIARRYSADAVIANELKKYDSTLYSAQSATAEAVARIHRPLFDDIANGLVFGGVTSSCLSSISLQVLSSSTAFDTAQQAFSAIDSYQNLLASNLHQDQAYKSVIDSVRGYVDSTQARLNVGAGFSELELFKHKDIERRFTSVFFDLPVKKKKTSRKKLKKTIEEQGKKILLLKSGYEEEREEIIYLRKQIKEIKQELRDEKLKTKALSINVISCNGVTKTTHKKKLKRTCQLHDLIWKVDQFLSESSTKVSAKSVLKELQRNYDHYDDKSIIEEITEDHIYWRSKGGTRQTNEINPIGKFSVLLSKVRGKFSAKP